MRMKKGFTLIELLVVIGIIALLVSILLPSLGRAQELARRTMCKTLLKGFGTGFGIYATSNDDQHPYNIGSNDTPREPTALNNLALFMLESKQGGEMFVCPSMAGSHVPLIVERVSSSDDATLILDEDDVERPENLISYSYQAAMRDANDYYNGSGVSIHAASGLAIMSDKTADRDSQVSDWDNKVLAKRGISQNHRGEMMNIMYKDTHVGDARRGDVGIDEDNIFTVSYATDDDDNPIGDPTGTISKTGEGHTYVDDSVLISDEGN